VVPILGGEFLCAQPALEFASVESSVVVAIETVKQRRCGRLCLVEVDRAVMIGIEELEGAAGPACRVGLGDRTCDAKDRGESEDFSGLFHVESPESPCKTQTA